MRLLWALMLVMAANCTLWGDALPEWIVPLREAIYEQKLKANEVTPIYHAAQATTRERCTGTSLDLALSRCEYLMGRALQYEERNDEARVHYIEGMRLAEKALTVEPSAEAWVIRAENLSQACALGPLSFTMSNGLNVDKFAKNALAINSRNAAAQILVAARWVYAPAPLHNHKRGIEMMRAVLDDGDMEKDDLFNVNVAIAYAHIQQKKYDEARPWLLKALEIYPSNKYANDLLAKKK